MAFLIIPPYFCEDFMKIIETKRLYLRKLRHGDEAELKKILSDPVSMQFYPHPFCREEVEQWVNWNLKNYATLQHGLWAVILKQDETFWGDCGITMQTIEHETVPEIGFHILPQYCCHGYATEAALACKQYAFDVLRYPAVFSYTTLQNIASQKVAQKIGMHFDRYFEKDGERHVVHVATAP